jgi:hypothetical protein
MGFLDRLEKDLLDAAGREDLGGWGERKVAEVPRDASEPNGRDRKRGSAPRWRIVVAATAAILSLAAAIGFVVQHTSSPSAQTLASPAGLAQGGITDQSAHQPSHLAFAAPSVTPAPGASGAVFGTAGLPVSRGGQQNSLGSATGSGTTREILAPSSINSSGNSSSNSQMGISNSVPQAHQTDFSKIERDGSISITVPKGQFGAAASKLAFITDHAGGMVLNSQTFKNTTGTFTLRVPASKFDRMMTSGIPHLVTGTTVTSQTTKSADVTANYIDLKERLSIAVQHRAVLRKLFSKANSPSQILQYQNLLDQIQLTIEQYQGQIRFINNQVAESTINVSMREVGAATPTFQPTVIKNPDLGNAWKHGIQGFLGVVGAVVIGLGYLVPIAVLLAIVWYLVGAMRRRRSQPAPAGGGGE